MCALQDDYIDYYYGTCNTQYQTSVIRLSSCSYHCRDLQALTVKNNNDFCTLHMRQYNFVVASNKLHPVLSNINFVSTSYSYLDEVNYSRQSFFLPLIFLFFFCFLCCFSIAFDFFLLWSKRYYARYLRIPLDFIPFHPSLVRKKYRKDDLIKHSSPYMVTISVSVLRFMFFFFFFFSFYNS